MLINDAFGEEFSLNNLLTFQADISSHVVENENQAAPSGNQSELINQHELPYQGANLSNFRYPTTSHFPCFLLPPVTPLNEHNDTSHIPISQLTSLEEVERNMSEASRKGKLPKPHGEGSSKQVSHFDTISPIATDIDEVFRDFWIVGETVKEVVLTYPKEIES